MILGFLCSFGLIAGSFSACSSIQSIGPLSLEKTLFLRFLLVKDVNAFPLSICSLKKNRSKYTWQHS